MSQGFEAIVSHNKSLNLVWGYNDREKTYDVISNSLVECKISKFKGNSGYLGYLRSNKPKIKQCYDNVFNFVVAHKEATYVLGFTHKISTLTHAWIKLDGKYYDPTAQMLELDMGAYGLVKEFSSEELVRLIEKLKRPPMLEDMHLWAGDCCKMKRGLSVLER